MVTMRWTVRAIGLGSTVVLARLLTPEDFGIVAMATLLIGLLTTFTEFGTSQLLIRLDNPERDHYDTAWTIMLAQSVCLAVLLIGLAPMAAIYFHEPRVVPVIQLIAISQVISGTQNIATVDFRRALDFGADFRLGVYQKLSTVIPTVALAIYLKNYWALVSGMILGQAIQVVISYWMRPYRPRLSLAKWREFLSYSFWITPANIAGFLNRKADVFVVGSVAATAQMGAYNVASELSAMATGEVVIPMARALYPNYAKLRNQKKELRDAFLNVVKTVSMIAFSFGLGLAAVANDVVHVILGTQWLSAIPLVEWLAVFGAFVALNFTLGSHVLISAGKERIVFYLNWLRLIVFGSSVALAGHFGGVQEVARAATISTALFTLVPVYAVGGVLSLPAAKLFSAIGRPMSIGVAMFLVVRWFHIDHLETPLLTLGLDVLVGAAVFLGLTFASWSLLGHPSGPETRVIEYLRQRITPTEP